MKIFSDNKIYVLDGAMGTQIMKRGIGIGICFEELNLSHPEIILSIHKSYVEAGANIIETNTFGASAIKLKGYNLQDKFREINLAAVKIAKKAAAGCAFVAASMGPLGELMEPMGAFSFDDAYDEFAAQAKILEEAGADLISIETMTDIQEARAALIAVKENTKLPAIIHMTFEKSGLTNTGTPPEVAALVFSSLGASAIGANCSSGPGDLLNVAKRLIKYSKVPVSIMPNAGNPEIIGGETVYRMTPQKFSGYANEFAKLGVKFIGGCCGTSPDHIKAIVKEIKKTGYRGQGTARQSFGSSFLTSRTNVLEIGKKSKLIIIGERINPTNRNDFKEELRLGKTNIIRQDAVSQNASGAHMLDINVGATESDEKSSMKKAVMAVQSIVPIPMSIDSANADVLEEGLKNYAGKALINSVNGKDDSINHILPLAKKYGAAVIALTLERGIPKKADERFKIAKKITDAALKIGIPNGDIFVDVLTLSAGAQQDDVPETLKAIKMVKSRLKVKTVLGVSNVSHGLPNRKILNASFLRLAVSYGLDAAIYNPENLKVKISQSEYLDAKEVLLNKDKGAKKWISKYGNIKKPEISVKPKKSQANILDRILNAVIEGDKDNVLVLIEEALLKNNPQSIIDNGLLPAMDKVGKYFNEGSYFLPQVMASSETMKAAFERVKKDIKKDEQKIIGTVITATVLGDIHDIGKNIIVMLLENHGFNVIDLGKDVPKEKIISSAKENKADLIMLSSLLTTTMPQMKIVKAELEKDELNIPIMVGGAPVTRNFAKSFGANFAKDAIEAVNEAKRIVTSQN